MQLIVLQYNIMRINRNNRIMETSPCKDYRQGPGQGPGQGLDLKDLTPKNQDKDKDLRNVLKESLRTRTRINIPAFRPKFTQTAICA